MAANPFENFQAATAFYHPDNAVALAEAARLAYGDPASITNNALQWGFPRCRFFDRRDTQAYVMANDQAIVVAFRGTQPDRLLDWMSDCDTLFVNGPFGRVHNGFNLALSRVWEDLIATVTELQDQGQSLWLTGHSLGAALATLASARWREQDKPVNGLYHFGSPRVGDRVFERTFDQDFAARNFRFVNNADLVTRVPLRVMGYSHTGTMLYFTDKGELKADPGWWDAFLNRMQGRIEDLGTMGPTDIKEHSSDQYVALTKKNCLVNPF
jgi:triacylglycerol lipase